MPKITRQIFSNLEQTSLVSKGFIIWNRNTIFLGTQQVLVISTVQDVWVIDQVWGQDGWILAKFFFCVFMDRDEVEVHKRMRPISSHLDRTSLVNKGFIIWDKTPKHDKLYLRYKARIPSGQDSSILPARVANHSARFSSSCPLTESYNKALSCLLRKPITVQDSVHLDCFWR